MLCGGCALGWRHVTVTAGGGEGKWGHAHGAHVMMLPVVSLVVCNNSGGPVCTQHVSEDAGLLIQYPPGWLPASSSL